MKVQPTALPPVLRIETARHEDARGFFMETFKQSIYRERGIPERFVQDNWSHSKKNVLRGLHFQRRQGKLVTVVRGEIHDVALDIRPDSESYGRWVSERLSASNGAQLYIPPGFAHGFYVVSDDADVWYKTTDVYRPEEEGGILWSDPALGIDWPAGSPLVSERDRLHPALADVDQDTLISQREIDAL